MLSTLVTHPASTYREALINVLPLHTRGVTTQADIHVAQGTQAAFSWASQGETQWKPGPESRTGTQPAPPAAPVTLPPLLGQLSPWFSPGLLTKLVLEEMTELIETISPLFPGRSRGNSRPRRRRRQ